MKDSVYAYLADEHQTLLSKLSANQELASVLMALLGRLIVTCAQRGKPFDGISLAPLACDTEGRSATFRSKVYFTDLSITMPAMWSSQSDFGRYAAQKASKMALALQQNPRMAGFFQALVESIDRWATDKGMAFEAIRVKNAILSTSDVLVLSLGPDILDA